MSESLQCIVCGDHVNSLIYNFHFENETEVLRRIKAEHSDWVDINGVCGRCVDYYQTEILLERRTLPEVGPHFPIKSPDDFIIIPTPLRIDADPKFSGKGVTICLIDSCFYPHDDLVRTRNRIKKIVDITRPDRNIDFFQEAHSESWHGTMTSVVCAGDGYSSNGLYKSIAYDAELVLIKTQITEEGHPENGRITSENIAHALEWILLHHREYEIRIVNISLGDSESGSYKSSRIDLLAEILIKEGVVIVAAAGNDINASIKAPANSPNVITVGGYDDNNTLLGENKLYHSSFGITADGIAKPELIAHAIWIAAPILPGTKEKEEAELLDTLLRFDDHSLDQYLYRNKFTMHNKISVDFDSAIKKDWENFRNQLRSRVQVTKFFSSSYMHVDGTSFAAPIVSSVIAQLLECEPTLNPADIRALLFSTAKHVDNNEIIRQGFGVVYPRKALRKLKDLKSERIINKKNV